MDHNGAGQDSYIALAPFLLIWCPLMGQTYLARVQQALSAYGARKDRLYLYQMNNPDSLFDCTLHHILGPSVLKSTKYELELDVVSERSSNFDHVKFRINNLVIVIVFSVEVSAVL